MKTKYNNQPQPQNEVKKPKFQDIKKHIYCSKCNEKLRCWDLVDLNFECLEDNVVKVRCAKCDHVLVGFPIGTALESLKLFANK